MINAKLKTQKKTKIKKKKQTESNQKLKDSTRN